MQNLDPSGQYSDAEVKAALTGSGGTRGWSFRYAHLDKNNQYLEDIDYVQSCSVENNALADIKRTAKFNILDTGTINYLQDRIQPFVRLNMPKDSNYSAAVKALSPAFWWKLDDPVKPVAAFSSTHVADGVTYNSRVSAYSTTATGDNYFDANIATGSGTLRSEIWYAYNNTLGSAQPLYIEWQVSSNTAPTTNYNVYFSPSSSGDLTLIYNGSVGAGTGVGAYSETFEFPQNGYYYVQMIATSPTAVNTTVNLNRPTRIEDSSGNGVVATGLNLGLGAAPIINDGGKGVTLNSQSNWSSDTFSMVTDGGVSLSFWLKVAASGTQWTNVSMKLQSDTYYVNYQLDWTMPNDPTLDITLHNSVTGQEFNGSVAFPQQKINDNKAHLVTFSVNPVTNEAHAYVDGTVAATFIGDLSPWAEAAENANYNFTHMNNYSDSATCTLDDVSVYGYALTHGQAANLFTVGLNSVPQRVGYVEWPQGIFLLSSPSRKMVDGLTISRDVEAYDQLLVLKEDSYDYRYSVGAGVKYTDAVRNILQSLAVSQENPFTDPIWKPDTYGVNVTGPDSVTLTPDSTTNDKPSIETNPDLSFGGLVYSAKIAQMDQVQTATMLVMANTSTGWPSTSVQGQWNTASANLSVTVQFFSGYTSLITLPNNVYFFRFRESGGSSFWDYSSDGITWTNLTSETHLLDPITSAQAYIGASYVNIVGGKALVSNMSLNGKRFAKEKVIRSDKILPVPMEWEPGTNKLTVVNDLLAAINYESAAYDENGIFVAKPYVAPSDRAAEFTYATDEDSVITGDIDQTVDLFAIPNKWVVVVSDPDRPALVGTYTNSDPMSPTSTVSRGRTVVDYRTEQNAPDQVTLTAKAQRLAYDASQVYEKIEFKTGLMPFHSDSDVFNIKIDHLSIENKYSEQSWSMDFEAGTTMTHKVRRIVNV